jgi:hypothetical protein
LQLHYCTIDRLTQCSTSLISAQQQQYVSLVLILCAHRCSSKLSTVNENPAPAVAVSVAVLPAQAAAVVSSADAAESVHE